MYCSITTIRLLQSINIPTPKFNIATNIARENGAK